MKSQKNNRTPFARTIGLVLIFLFSALFSRAQEEEKNGAIAADTTLDSPPTEDAIETGTGSTEQDYFSARTDTLVVLQRTIPADAVKKMKSDEDFWYADSVISKKVVKPPVKERAGNNTYVPLGQRAWFQTLLWIVILGVFILFLTIYLGGSQVGLFRKKNIRTAGHQEEAITEDIFAINYQKEIDKAVASGNYRLAVRLLFLRLLKTMSEKNIIRYKQDKTNLDYLMELHPTTHYHQFFRITRNYEYSWYGQFPVSEEAWQQIRNDFDNMDKALK